MGQKKFEEKNLYEKKFLAIRREKLFSVEIFFDAFQPMVCSIEWLRIIKWQRKICRPKCNVFRFQLYFLCCTFFGGHFIIPIYSIVLSKPQLLVSCVKFLVWKVLPFWPHNHGIFFVRFFFELTYFFHFS